MSVSSVSGGNFEALAVAMNKRVVDEQGRAALSLIEATVQSVEQTNAVAASAANGVGGNVNTYA